MRTYTYLETQPKNTEQNKNERRKLVGSGQVYSLKTKDLISVHICACAFAIRLNSLHVGASAKITKGKYKKEQVVL